MRAWFACLLCLACRNKAASPNPGEVSPPAVGLPAAVPAIETGSEPAAALEVELLHRAGAAVAVSSAVVNPKIHPGDLVDGDAATAWNSRTGDLVGAWIAFRVPAAARVMRIAMTAGFTAKGAGGDYFAMNPRIREVRIVRDGVELRRVPLDPASRELQPLAIDAPGGEYRIEVTAIAPGSRARWREICVSELQVWGAPAPGTSDERAPPPVTVGGFTPPPPPEPDDSDAEIGCAPPESTEVPDGTVEIEVCTTGVVRHGQADDGFIEYQRHGTLTLKPAGIRTDLDDWTDGWEWGSQWSVVGVLRGPRRKLGLLVAQRSHGPSPGLSAYAASLYGLSIKSGAWNRVPLGSANSVSASVDADDRSAEVVWKRVKDDDPYSDLGAEETTRITFDGTRFATTPMPGD